MATETSAELPGEWDIVTTTTESSTNTCA